jgi:hypothetical protein
MQSIFGLFETYEHAEAAVDELLDEGFEIEEMNVVVQSGVAREYMDVNLERVDVQVTDEVGERAEPRLGTLLGAEHPVRVPGLDETYAAGKLATVLVKTAMAPGTGGFTEALVDFDVPAGTARSHTEALKRGALLFWIRVADERGAEAAHILREHHAQSVANYVG